MIDLKKCTECGKKIKKPTAIFLGFPRNEVWCGECVENDIVKRGLRKKDISS